MLSIASMLALVFLYCGKQLKGIRDSNTRYFSWLNYLVPLELLELKARMTMVNGLRTDSK